jgi:hypothetical protein
MYHGFTEADGSEYATNCKTVSAAIKNYVGYRLANMVEKDPYMSGAAFGAARDKLLAYARSRDWKRPPQYFHIFRLRS